MPHLAMTLLLAVLISFAVALLGDALPRERESVGTANSGA